MEDKLNVDAIFNKAKSMLIFHCLRMYIRILYNSFKTFGIKKWVLYYYLFKIPIKLLFIHVSLLLDNIFFPKYRDVKIEKPVFIFGHPRSATSFFHALLSSSGDFLAFKNWEIYNPSLTIRKIFEPFKTFRLLFSLISDFRYTPHRIKHEIKQHKEGLKGKLEDHKQTTELLGQMEEEFLFLHVLDTQFVAMDTPLGFSENGFPELCFADDQPHQEKSVLFFKNLLKRQSYYTGKKQIVAKMNFSLFRLKTLLKIFPDAKIIFIVRSPLETINSHLSAQREVLDLQYGLDNISDDKKKQFFENRYKYNILFYQRFLEIMDSNTIPKEQLQVITYDSIKNDLKGRVQQVKSFTDIEFSTELESSIREQDTKQSSYKRKHVNLPLEEFNLTEDKIRSDFDFFFKRYRFK